LVKLYPDWIFQLVCTSLTWRSLDDITMMSKANDDADDDVLPSKWHKKRYLLLGVHPVVLRRGRESEVVIRSKAEYNL